VEKRSLLCRLAQEQGKSSALALFGSLKNMAERLLESLRNLWWPEESFAPRRLQIRFDSTSSLARCHLLADPTGVIMRLRLFFGIPRRDRPDWGTCPMEQPHERQRRA
jgi:hypothetical protein